MDTEKYCELCRSKKIEQMLEAFCAISELDELVERMAELFNNPIHITDISYKLLASSEMSDIDDEGWKETAELGYLSTSLVRNAVKVHISQIPRNPNEHIWFFCKPDFCKYSNLVSYIYNKEDLLGYLCMLTVNGEPNDDEIHIIYLLNKLLAKLLAAQKATNILEKLATFEHMLIALIENSGYDKEFMHNRIVAAQLDSAERFCLVNLYASDRHKYIKDTLKNIFPYARIFYYNSQLLILFPYSDGAFGLSAYELEQLAQMAKSTHSIICISDEFQDLEDISKYYKRNKRVLEIARAYKQYMGGTPDCIMNNILGRFIYKYDKLKYLDMAYMHALTHGLDEMLGHASSDVLRIAEYDNKNNTSLLDTLYVFLEQKQSFMRTAEMMFTHRNTIVYRIEKIKSLIDVDFTRGDVLGHLHFSCVIVQMYNILKHSDPGFAAFQ